MSEEANVLRKLLLMATAPFQGLILKPSPTHSFINQQALAILKNDGNDQEATWLSQYLPEFNRGCDWADTSWMNIGHMYNPQTGCGLKGWPSAPQLAREYWDFALGHIAGKNPGLAFFYLGAAAHLVQDLCVPHHACAKLLAGHKQFEEYGRRYYDHFAVAGDGMYTLARTPEGWVIKNAEYTYKHYSDCVTGNLDRKETHRAIMHLLPRAQRTTAGFVAYFLSITGVC